MAIAKLQVLDEYETDAGDYLEFQDALGRWACKWTGGIASGIAKASRELFGIQAVRMLVLRWDELDRQGRDARLREFASLCGQEGDGGEDVLERNTWEREAGEISQALYFLLVQ